jgi:hypothetical protein
VGHGRCVFREILVFSFSFSSGLSYEALRPGKEEAATAHSLKTFSDINRSEINSTRHGQSLDRLRQLPDTHHPLPYTRRVEGIFDDARDLNGPSSTGPSSTNNILEGLCFLVTHARF